MFLLMNSSHRFRSWGLLVYFGVKFHVPEAFPYYRLIFLCVASHAGNRKSPPVCFSHLPTGFWGFLRILFFRPGSVQASAVRQDWLQSAPPALFPGFLCTGAAVYLIHRGCGMTSPSMPCFAKNVVVAAAESFFSNAAVRPSSATALSNAFAASACQRRLQTHGYSAFLSQTSFAPIFSRFLLEGSVICFKAPSPSRGSDFEFRLRSR